jgi:hypothetical protein
VLVLCLTENLGDGWLALKSMMQFEKMELGKGLHMNVGNHIGKNK